MNKTETLALENLDTLLSATQQVNQLPLARKLASRLNISVKLWFWNKKPAKLAEANREFDHHPLGSGETDPKYLECACVDSVAEGKFCLKCGRRFKKKK